MLKEIAKDALDSTFWHEKNGLRFVDSIEVLEDENRYLQNLYLTYAVRDGIISHCGEVDDARIFPRSEYIDLQDFNKPGEYQSYSWEGCVVKLSDKIAYLGRDIEDANRLKLLRPSQLYDLKRIARKYKMKSLNTTSIMHDLITDICSNSTPKDGLALSSKYADMLYEIKKYNYRNIYLNERLSTCKKYIKLMITSIFETLERCYDEEKTLHNLRKQIAIFPKLMTGFSTWLLQRCSIDCKKYPWAVGIQAKCKNTKIYSSLQTKDLYIQAIIDYISGMTDQYAIKTFEELVRF